MFSVVTSNDSPKAMTEGTEKYFSGTMYEYDNAERREIEVRNFDTSVHEHFCH